MGASSGLGCHFNILQKAGKKIFVCIHPTCNHKYDFSNLKFNCVKTCNENTFYVTLQKECNKKPDATIAVKRRKINTQYLNQNVF